MFVVVLFAVVVVVGLVLIIVIFVFNIAVVFCVVVLVTCSDPGCVGSEPVALQPSGPSQI